MKSLEFTYRSTSRPDPLWVEPALYGGYTHLQIADNLWIPRSYEYLISCIYSDTISDSIKAECRNLLKTVQPFQPSPKLASNRCKLASLISRTRTLAVVGYTYSFEEFLKEQHYTTLYTTKEYSLPNSKTASVETLIQNSSHILTLVHVSQTHLKEDILNWGNIVVFSDELLYDTEGFTQLQGGKYATKQLT